MDPNVVGTQITEAETISKTRKLGSDKFISWARYLYWSELNRQRFLQLTEQSEELNPSDKWKWLAFMSQFYASLWVVIEGWKTLKLDDPAIESLIAGCPEYCRMLKKFRDSVYHCSPSLLDSRSLKFIKQGEAAVFWASALHEEFQRFYWEWPEMVMVSPEQVDRMRRSLLAIIGWLPTDLIEIHKRDLMDICAEAERIMKDAGDISSPHALALANAVRQAREAAIDSPAKIFLPEFKKRFRNASE
jgi:hypothetical protein